MTPEQIALVERSLASIDVDDLTVAFYERAFAAEPAIAAMFTTDPAVQRARFAAELGAIVASIRSLDTMAATARALGARHRGYGVCAAHYRLMGDALSGALAEALGSGWTDDVDEAWTMAYNLTAELMMTGALENSATD
jgi:hemoglobin-like flavoprotein